MDVAEEAVCAQNLSVENCQSINRWKEKTVCDITSSVPMECLPAYMDIMKENIELEESHFKIVDNIIHKLVTCETDSLVTQKIEIENTSLYGVFHCKKETNQSFTLSYAIHMLFYETNNYQGDNKIDAFEMDNYQLEAAYEALEELGVYIKTLDQHGSLPQIEGSISLICIGLHVFS